MTNRAEHRSVGRRSPGESATKAGRATGGDVRLRIDLAYDGAGFHGWQQQAGLRTVQGELSLAASTLLGASCTPVGAGRTDAGVHARGQVCHLSVKSEAAAERMQKRLHCLVPDDIQIVSVRPVSRDFNARFSAIARRYSYRLLLQRDVFAEPFALYVPYPLDREAMCAAADRLLGRHDFTSFCKKASLKRTPDGNSCQVDLCRFDWSAREAILHIRADHFLHNMVRNIVGTLLQVGRSRIGPDDLNDILAARDRARAGRKAAAKGLCLEEVLYPRELLDPVFRRPAGSAAGTSAFNSEGD